MPTLAKDSVLVQTKNTATVRMQSSQITQLRPQPSLASPAASTCQFIVARTRATLVLLTDIKIAAEAAVLSFCASITCAIRSPLVADPRFAVRGGGLANATLEELHLVCSCDHQVYVTIAIPVYEARDDTNPTNGTFNGQVSKRRLLNALKAAVLLLKVLQLSLCGLFFNNKKRISPKSIPNSEKQKQLPNTQ